MSFQGRIPKATHRTATDTAPTAGHRKLRLRLSNEVSDQEIHAALATDDCRRASSELVDIALARGGRDNITAVVVQAEDPHASDKTLLNPAP